MNTWIEKAASVLDGEPLTRETACQLARLPGEDVLDLIALANRVRNRFASGFHGCSILNAKSGMCGEDCRFCAQSAAHATGVDVYPLVNIETMLDAAQAAWDAGLRSFGIVTSGYGYLELNEEFRAILAGMDAIHERWPEMGVCASLGILGDETATALAVHQIQHYNLNLQTAPDRYGELIATTHRVEQRMNTIRLLKQRGVTICSGGIIGLNDTMDDRIALGFTLRELDVDVIPLNVLVPIPGTPLASQAPVRAVDAARTFALFRLINPTKVIKFAAGRETVMSDFQGLLMLSGANGFITGGYLTTRGRAVAQDLKLMEHLQGFSGTGAEPPS